MSDQYGWKFLLDGVDITNKVSTFSIETSLDMYCRELSFSLTDEALYYTFDFSVIPEEPRVEVFTRITDDIDPEDEYDYIWISQGLFFIERPTFTIDAQTTTTGLWGRQSTAILGEPFAQKVTKLWDTDTSFYDICEEILESVGLTWDDSRCAIQNFIIFADNFEADDIYPIDVLKNLIDLIVGAEGFVVSDREGFICIKRLDRLPITYDYNITDLIVQNIQEEPEWPEFGNRIKIIPVGSLSQDSVALYLENQCLGTGAASVIDIYAQVTDGEGVPLTTPSVITWSFDPLLPERIWYKYPSVGKSVQQNTSTMLISNELKRASGFSSVELAFIPSSIIGIWAYADKARLFNFAPPGGYVIDEKSVLLTDESFLYCDQQVFVSYYADGMARNTIIYSLGYTEPEGAESAYGSLTAIASVSGKEDTAEVYVNNSCKCQSTLSVKVNPSTIIIGQSQAKISAYLENSGSAVSGIIRMVEVTGKGTLDWSAQATSTIRITDTKSEVINAIVGVSQCVVPDNINSVVSVYQVDSDGNAFGSNMYSSFSGKVIDLNSIYPTGTNVVVDYWRAGSVDNYLTGAVAGTSQINVSADVSNEAGLVQTVQVTVQAAPVVTPDPVPDEGGGSGGSDEGGGSGGSGDTGTTPPSTTYYVSGPGLVHRYGFGWVEKPEYYTLKASDGSPVSGNSVFCTGGSGQFRIGVGCVYFSGFSMSPNSYTIRCEDNYGHSAEMTVMVIN